MGLKSPETFEYGSLVNGALKVVDMSAFVKV